MSILRTDPVAWITGAGGLIGNCLVQSAPRLAHRWRVIGLTRHELDLLDFDAVRDAFRRDRPQLLIHCAALTKTAVCQKEPALAKTLNVDVTAMLAELAKDIPFIFFSTDLVFDGRSGNYDELATINPFSVYAQNKVAAESVVLANPRHTVIRTSLNGGTSPTGDRGFNEILRQAFQAGQKLTLFTDEYRCPIPASVTARATWELAFKHQTGLFHVAGAERLSRWQIGQLLAARWPQFRPHIEPESIKTYQGAPRSPDTSLNCAKAQRILSFPLPGLTEWLSQHPEESF